MNLTIDKALQKGIEAHKSGNLREADKCYTAILAVQPKHADANHNMGVLAVDFGKVEKAVPFFKTALEVNQSIEQFWLSYIDALIKLGRKKDARSAYNQAKEKSFKSDTFVQLEARLYPSQARSFKKPLHQDPPSDRLQALIDLYNHGKLDEALSGINDALVEFSQSVSLFNLQGVINARLKKLDTAIESYKRALQIKPDYAEAFYNIGNCLKDKGDLAGAIDSFEQAVKIRPSYAKAYYNIGNCLKDKGDLVNAAENYQQAIKAKPDYADAYNNMGIIFRNQGRLEEAIEAYKKALTIEPKNAKMLMNLSNVKGLAVPAWHVPMINDQIRNEAYLKALKLAVSDKDLVLEIGTGSGLLALMAADCGASQVISCESSKSIYKVAEKIISENGYNDRIRLINKRSTDIQVGEDLPSKADVVVSEVLSAEFVGEGVQSTISDANNRLKKTDGKMIPESGDIKIALLGSSVEINENVFVGNINGFNLSKFSSITSDKISINLKKKPKLLCQTTNAFKLSLNDLKHRKVEEKILNLTVTRNGLCLGIIQWLKIKVFADIEYENKPGESASHWPSLIYLFQSPIELTEGEVIKIRASLFEDAVWFDRLE